MKPDYTHIILVLDRSGSMETVRADTIGGFNAFLQEQKAVPGQATLTLVQFDNEYDVLHDFTPLAAVQPLTTRTYVPRGSTALLDAMGRTINETGARLAGMPEAERPARVLFVVMTDGLENASHHFTRADVFDKITHQRTHYAWEFVFIGANQDAIATGAGMGIAASHSIAYAHTSAGTADIMEKFSKNTSRRRVATAAAAASAPMPAEPDEFFTQEDRDTRPDLPKGSR
jgi:Mg-chelatase subunit ChlD